MWSLNITSYSKKEMKFSLPLMLISDVFRLKVPKIAQKGT